MVSKSRRTTKRPSSKKVGCYTAHCQETKQRRFNTPIAEFASRWKRGRSLRNLTCLVMDASGGHTSRELINHGIPSDTITAFTGNPIDYLLIPDTELRIEKLCALASKLYSEPRNFGNTAIVIHDGQQSGKNTLSEVKEIFKHGRRSLAFGCNVSTRASDRSHKWFSSQLTLAARRAGYIRTRTEKMDPYRQQRNVGVTMQPFWFEFELAQ